MTNITCITWNGMTKTKREWAEHFSIHVETLSRKMKRGIPFEKMGERQTANMKGRPRGAKDLKPRKPGAGRFPKSDEHKAKISAALKGHATSDETRAKISAAKKAKRRI